MTSKQIDYYSLEKVEAESFLQLLQDSIERIKNVVKDTASISSSNDTNTDAAVTNSLTLYNMAVIVFADDTLSKFLKLLARLPVFSKDFEELLKNNLEVLSILKKLKFFVNLQIRETLYLLVKLSIASVDEDEVDKMVLSQYFDQHEETDKSTGAIKLMNMVDLKFKDAVRQDVLFSADNADKRAEYLAEFEKLEKIEPHAIYPTSIYRQSDGCTVATSSSHKIEAVMSTTLTSSIRISSHVLGFDSNLLAEIYRPLGRAVIVLDDKLDDPTYTLGHVDMSTNKRATFDLAKQQDDSSRNFVSLTIRQQMERYFTHHKVQCNILTRSGNEADKDIENVQEILVELKKLGVMRNEPVLIVGGGVIADIAGFACALFHRNTPYVMLATSIVAGIDAGPSPRTCCDGQGYKNAFGAFHPPVVTLTDRTLWSTMHSGMIRHGIAEIVKMACVENRELFELLEKVGPKYLVKTKFGNDLSQLDENELATLDLKEFNQDCERVVGMAMESYVRAEFGNLWETHQCRPHAFGHTWSPGYELPAGMLHGHAVATCMGFGAYLSWKHCDWIDEEQCHRICKLINDLELSLWHDVMDDKEIFHSCTKKMVQKRGGNLAAPIPRGNIGEVGYLNNITDEQLSQYVDEYKLYVTSGNFARNGYGVEPLLLDVGLDETSTEAMAHVRAEIAQDKSAVSDKAVNPTYEEVEAEEKKDMMDDEEQNEHKRTVSYQTWIENMQSDRNASWKMNVQFGHAPDTDTAPHFPHNTLFRKNVEEYAMAQTSVASDNIQAAAKVTVDEDLFAPCMVGSLESQFLKLMAKTKGAQKCLDIGCFTGSSAIAFAEGALAAASKKGTDTSLIEVHTLENDYRTAQAAEKIFGLCEPLVKNAINLFHGDAISWMREYAMQPNGKTFDIIFIDADKDNYLAYYDLAMGDSGLRPLLSDDGIIMADNTLSALVYDEDDSRRRALHLFNQHVKNDQRVEQAVMTVREGITIISRV